MYNLQYIIKIHLMIYEASDNDISVIRNIAKITWPQTYGKILSSEQIDYMLELIYSQKSLERQFKDGHRFYILKEFDEAVGFIDIQKVSGNISKLHKIYLLPKVQGLGYGQMLINYAFDKALENGTPILQLNANRYNTALNFYKKNGFKIIDETDIAIGNNYFMNDYVMEKIIE